MVNIEELVKSIRLKEKTTFLKKCLKFKILLPSNSKKGVDRDLLIIQQQRRLKVCLKSIKNAIGLFVFAGFFSQYCEYAVFIVAAKDLTDPVNYDGTMF